MRILKTKSFSSSSGTIKGRLEYYDDQSLMVKLRFIHPMESGQRISDSSTGVEKHIIESVKCWLDEEQVFHASFGTGVAKNPPLFFRIKKYHSGERLEVRWQDDRQQADETSIFI